MDIMCLNTFLYFAYGSNLLLKRIHINNPSATRVGIGKLEDYRLDFNYKSKRWGGASATIVPDKGSHVWGALWRIHNDNMPSLDRQEGVDVGVYQVVPVTVWTLAGEEVRARSYQLVSLPPTLGPTACTPPDRLPSKVYLDTIIEGAVESGLPVEYIQKLKMIKHNEYNGPVRHDCD